MDTPSSRARRPAGRKLKPDLKRIGEMHAHAGEAAGFLKALGNEQRLMILCSLLAGPLSVGELNERVDLSQSALSQHLALLREAGLVETRREAQSIVLFVACRSRHPGHGRAAGHLLPGAETQALRWASRHGPTGLQPPHSGGHQYNAGP